MTVLHEEGTFTGQVKRTRTHHPSSPHIKYYRNKYNKILFHLSSSISISTFFYDISIQLEIIQLRSKEGLNPKKNYCYNKVVNGYMQPKFKLFLPSSAIRDNHNTFFLNNPFFLRGEFIPISLFWEFIEYCVDKH